jgi:hypothetical protein
MEGKGGVTSRSGANYSTWWNGGLRTSPYFHNQIGLLTETIGNPTPVNVPFVQDKNLPKTDMPLPIGAQQKWQFRQSIEYSITANRAALDYASRNKDRLLFDVYQMGVNSIERGNRDTWTITPRRVKAAKTADELHAPTWRDPRGYIIPADQPDFLTATKFVNALIKNGVTVQRATGAFAVKYSTCSNRRIIRTISLIRAPRRLRRTTSRDGPSHFKWA